MHQVLPSSMAFLQKGPNEIQNEFQQLSNPYLSGGIDPHQFPELSEGLQLHNAQRNRYENILPNNATRVKLEGRQNDYINASHCLKGRVIICQGPLEVGENFFHSHHADFYHMIWTNNCTAIAMLTNYIEKGYIKCSFYLPCMAESKSVGDYMITVNSDESNEDAIFNEQGIKITRLFIKKNNGEQRTLTHYHLPSWEDSQGTSAKSIALLTRTLLKKNNPVIHCSAGIGRSGTIVVVMDAYSQLLDLLKSNASVPTTLVSDVTTSLRCERRGCIQTLAQYQTVYDALKELLNQDTNKEVLPDSETF